jgi:c-di-GMP-binding flagellar brake protein YcgR
MASHNSDGATGSPDSILPRHVFEAKIRIHLHLERDSKKLSLQGWARDLSESGLGAFVAEALALGEMVTLEIPLTDTDQQTIPAKVVRAVGTEIGFQFTALSAAQRQQIQATLKGRPAIPYPGNRQ